MADLEHVNMTVKDPKATADMLCDVFGWEVRWEGSAMEGAGYTVHVGNERGYLAVYSGSDPDQVVPKRDASYATRGGLNHVGVTVDDLDAVRVKVTARGYTTGETFDYEPGRRFYFLDENGVEFEVVSYD